MKTGDHVIVVYAILPADKWDGVKFPKGTYAKAFNAGPIESFGQVQTCREWGALMAASFNKLAKKICPVAGTLLNIGRNAE